MNYVHITKPHLKKDRKGLITYTLTKNEDSYRAILHGDNRVPRIAFDKVRGSLLEFITDNIERFIGKHVNISYISKEQQIVTKTMKISSEEDVETLIDDIMSDRGLASGLHMNGTLKSHHIIAANINVLDTSKIKSVKPRPRPPVRLNIANLQGRNRRRRNQPPTVYDEMVQLYGREAADAWRD